MSFEIEKPEGVIPGAEMKVEMKAHFSELLGGDLADADRKVVALAESVIDSFADESSAQFFTVVYPPDELSKDWLLKLATYVVEASKLAQGVEFEDIDTEAYLEVQGFGEELLGLRKAIAEHNQRLLGQLGGIADLLEGSASYEQELDDAEDPPMSPSEEEVDERLKQIMRIVYLAAVGDAHLDDKEIEALEAEEPIIRFLLQHGYAVSVSLAGGAPYLGVDVDGLITKYQTSSAFGGLALHLHPLHEERAAVQSTDELYEMYAREAEQLEYDYDRKVAAFAMLHVAAADAPLSDGEAHVFTHIFSELWGMDEDDFEEVQTLPEIIQASFD